MFIFGKNKTEKACSEQFNRVRTESVCLFHTVSTTLTLSLTICDTVTNSNANCKPIIS